MLCGVLRELLRSVTSAARYGLGRALARARSYRWILEKYCRDVSLVLPGLDPDLDDRALVGAALVLVTETTDSYVRDLEDIESKLLSPHMLRLFFLMMHAYVPVPMPWEVLLASKLTEALEISRLDPALLMQYRRFVTSGRYRTARRAAVNVLKLALFIFEHPAARGYYYPTALGRFLMDITSSFEMTGSPEENATILRDVVATYRIYTYVVRLFEQDLLEQERSRLEELAEKLRESNYEFAYEFLHRVLYGEPDLVELLKLQRQARVLAEQSQRARELTLATT